MPINMDTGKIIGNPMENPAFQEFLAVAERAAEGMAKRLNVNLDLARVLVTHDITMKALQQRLYDTIGETDGKLMRADLLKYAKAYVTFFEENSPALKKKK